MASVVETAEDAITAEEITGQAPTVGPPPAQRNAFTALMSPKEPASTPNLHSTTTNPDLIPISPSAIKNFSGRNGLGAYLSKPETFPANEVLFHTRSFVAINDLYPKSAVHTLLLPRDLSHALKHPLLALQDEAFLAELKQDAAKLKRIAASELRRQFGAVSETERARREAMLAEGDSTDKELPAGRDWERDIIMGVHSGPSMTHLHLHVMSPDMHRECMRHRKHYNSFNTPFFVRLEEFPLPEGEIEKRLERRAGWLAEDFVCWRCGKKFGNKFKELKGHLEQEFEEWQKE